jgi:hypothetical protein
MINQCTKVDARSKGNTIMAICASVEHTGGGHVLRLSIPVVVATAMTMKRQRHIELIGLELGRIMCN